MATLPIPSMLVTPPTYTRKEEQLHKLTGDDPQNPTLALPSREVFARGQREVAVSGPQLEEEAAEAHQGFWHPSSIAEDQ